MVDEQKKYIQVGTIRRMLKDFFPEDKITTSALNRLVLITEDFIRMTYLDAKKYAEAGNRKTIMEKDVILATT